MLNEFHNCVWKQENDKPVSEQVLTSQWGSLVSLPLVVKMCHISNSNLMELFILGSDLTGSNTISIAWN